MKYWFIWLLIGFSLSYFSVDIVVASCDPSLFTGVSCGLNWVTITQENICNAVSDTSKREVYKVYDGPCLDYPVVDSKQKENVFLLLDRVLGKWTVLADKWYLPAYEIRESISEALYKVLLANAQQEYGKWYDYMDVNKMALIHYIANLIGYNYRFPNRNVE